MVQKVSALLALLVGVLALALAPPAHAAKRCGTLTTTVSPLTFKAFDIRSYGGMSCKRARTVTRALARRRATDFEGCAVPVANDGTCTAAGFVCEDVSVLREIRLRCERGDFVVLTGT